MSGREGRVAVAVHERRLPALEACAGALAADVDLVPVDADGRLDARAAGDVAVLWRPVPNPAPWTEAVLERLPRLRWLHTDSVGVDGLPLAGLAARGVVVTNGAGTYSRPMAEWVVLALLAAAKRLPDFVRQGDRGEWSRGPELRELAGAVVLLLGLGSVNSLVAELLEPFRAEVRAVVRRPPATPPRGVAATVPFEEWREHLPDADFVVLGVPLTEATEGVVDADALGRLKPGAWLVNPARGALVDESALLDALDRGGLGGAVLDAFAEEPLPPGHPLWGRPDVVVTPHYSWSSTAVAARRTELFVQQLAAWLAAEPLRNVVDPAKGY